MTKKKKSSMAHDAMGLTATSTIYGVGAQVTTAAGGSAAGLTAASTMLPAVGRLVGTKHLINAVGDLTKTIPKAKRKRRK